MGDNTIPFKIQWCVIDSLNDRWKNLHPIGHNLGVTKPDETFWAILSLLPADSVFVCLVNKRVVVKWSLKNSQDILSDLPVSKQFL